MAMNQHGTTQELLGAVCSVVCTAAAAVQQHSRHICAAMNQHSMTEELMETVFYKVHAKGLSMGQVQSLVQ
jgi:hypothetical protein